MLVIARRMPDGVISIIRCEVLEKDSAASADYPPCALPPGRRREVFDRPKGQAGSGCRNDYPAGAAPPLPH